MSFNIFEPWRDAEAHAARLEEEYRKYGTGNCESCGKTVWHDEHFCAECMAEAVEDLKYCAACVAEVNGWPYEIAIETAARDPSRGKRSTVRQLYDAAAREMLEV